MGRKDTWEAYSEYAGGYVTSHGKGLTEAEAIERARQVAEYDCHQAELHISFAEQHQQGKAGDDSGQDQR